MFNEELLDRMNFGDLNESLDYVLESIGKLEDELSEDEDDPRLDMFYVLANKIVVRMDSIVRESGCPEALAQWKKVMDDYEDRFEKYADTLLEEDTLLDLE